MSNSTLTFSVELDVSAPSPSIIPAITILWHINYYWSHILSRLLLSYFLHFSSLINFDTSSKKLHWRNITTAAQTQQYTPVGSCGGSIWVKRLTYGVTSLPDFSAIHDCMNSYPVTLTFDLCGAAWWVVPDLVLEPGADLAPPLCLDFLDFLPCRCFCSCCCCLFLLEASVNKIEKIKWKSILLPLLIMGWLCYT